MATGNLSEPLSKEEYAKVAGHVTSYGSLAMAMGVATETGISDVLYKADNPLSSADIAQRAGLKERYTREVLNAMVASRLLQLVKGVGEEELYVLQSEHREMFRGVSGFSGLLGCVGRLSDQIHTCFQAGKPDDVRYNDTTRKAMAHMKDSLIETFLQTLLKLPGLQQRLEAGIQVAELGSGLAQLCRLLAAKFPRSNFTVSDITLEALGPAKELVEAEGLRNISLEEANAFDLPKSWSSKFDLLITIDVIHDLPYPQKAVDQIAGALKPGGLFCIIDRFTNTGIANNVGSVPAFTLYSLSIFLCIPESYQQPDSEALGPCWGQQKAREILKNAGLDVISMTKDMCPGALEMCISQKKPV